MTTFVEMYHPSLPGTPHVECPLEAEAVYSAHGWLAVDGNTPAPEAIYLTPGTGDLRYLKQSDVSTSGTATGDALRAAFGTVTTPEAYGAKGDGTTDDTAAIQAAMQAIYNAGGGTLVFAAKTYYCTGQLVPPTDGASTYPRGVSMRWVGAGAYTDPVGSGGPYPSQVGAGGTFLDLRYSGGGSNLPKIDTRGKGLLEISGITFTDLGTSSNPFIQTTNTTLHIHDCAFAGNPSKAGTTCDQDAIVLGGTTTVTGGNGSDAPFQGYGTVIAGNYFARIRRAVYGRVFCNGVVIRDNNIWISCGSNLAGGAAIEINPGSGSTAVGNLLSGNLIEIAHYVYGMLLDYAQGNSLIGNNFYDPTNGTSLACIRFASVNAKQNLAVLGYGSITGAWSGGAHVSEQTAGVNQFIDPLSTGLTQLIAVPSFLRGMKTTAAYNQGAGTPEWTVGGAANPPGFYVGTGSPNGVITANTGSIFLRTDGDYGTTLYVKEVSDGANTGWLPFGPTAVQPLVTKTANYAVQNGDRVILTNGAAVTVTLPAAVASNAGKTYTVKNLNAASATVSVSGGGNIDAAASVSLAQYAKGTFVSDGTQWWQL